MEVNFDLVYRKFSDNKTKLLYPIISCLVSFVSLASIRATNISSSKHYNFKTCKECWYLRALICFDVAVNGFTAEVFHPSVPLVSPSVRSPHKHSLLRCETGTTSTPLIRLACRWRCTFSLIFIGSHYRECVFKFTRRCISHH